MEQNIVGNPLQRIVLYGGEVATLFDPHQVTDPGRIYTVTSWGDVLKEGELTEPRHLHKIRSPDMKVLRKMTRDAKGKYKRYRTPTAVQVKLHEEQLQSKKAKLCADVIEIAPPKGVPIAAPKGVLLAAPAPKAAPLAGVPKAAPLAAPPKAAPLAAPPKADPMAAHMLTLASVRADLSGIQKEMQNFKSLLLGAIGGRSKADDEEDDE